MPTDGGSGSDGSDSHGWDGGSVNGASAAPSDPADIARELGLEGMIELIGQDPEAAGQRGEDLLRELGHDITVVDDVAEATRVVLTELEADPDSDDPGNADPDNPDNPDNPEDDDDDD